jgi:quercetin dioxygenase-like cupin family protein
MFVTDINEKSMCQSPNGNKVYWLVTTEQGAPNYEMRYIEIPAGGRTHYGHHSHEHEVFIVNGNGWVKGKETSLEISPRKAVFIQCDEEHQFINASKTEPLGVICIVPKGAEANYKPPCENK